MSKRPWTPGPWEAVGRIIGQNINHDSILWWAKFHLNLDDKDLGVEGAKANALLASKSPEMAEFIIKFREYMDDAGYSTRGLNDLKHEAIDLLKEIGYEPEK